MQIDFRTLGKFSVQQLLENPHGGEVHVAEVFKDNLSPFNGAKNARLAIAQW